MAKYRITFPESSFSAIELEEGEELSENLTIENSPILFACRTGVCGTCLVRAEGGEPEPLPTASEGEQEVLALLTEGEPSARLACQLRATCHMALTRID